MAGYAMTEITIEQVEHSLKELYRREDKPRADLVQIVLDRIEAVADEKRRTILFCTAKQNTRGEIRDLVIASRARANKVHGL